MIKYKPMEARLNRRDRVRLFLNLIERTVNLKAHFRLYYFSRCFECSSIHDLSITRIVRNTSRTYASAKLSFAFDLCE